MHEDYHEELKRDRDQLLKDLKKTNRKARFAEYVGSVLVVFPSVLLILGDGKDISLNTAVGLIGSGLLFFITGIRYFIVAATMPATRFALDKVAQEIERTSPYG